MKDDIFKTENQRLKHLQTELGFKSQASFAEKLGIKQGSLSDIYREKSGVGVSSAIKRILEKDFSINIDWLETGEGEMINETTIKETINHLNQEEMNVSMLSRAFDALERRDQLAFKQQELALKQQEEYERQGARIDEMIALVKSALGVNDTLKKRNAG